MPKTKISEFSATPANNTDIDSINISEGCAPSGINDAIRELMAQLKDFQTGAVGDSFNGPVGSTTASTGAFTTLSASSTLSVTGAGSIQGLTVGRGAGAVATNTAVGASALAANTSGSNNVAVGNNAGYSNTTGYVTAVGSAAGLSNTTGAISAFGYAVGYANTTGAGNAVFGGYDGSADPTFRYNTTGSYNTAMGFGALAANTTASNNTAVGYQAGYSNSTGEYNTYIGGRGAGYNATGSQNTFVGDYAGREVTTGSINTLIGQGAGYLITSGSKNTVLGLFTGNQGGLDIRTASNYIVLSDGDGNPRLFLQADGSLRCLGVYNNAAAASNAVNVDANGNVYRSTSALKYKTNVRDLEDIDINLFRPVRYNSKCAIDNPEQDHFGLIADEVHAAGITELVNYGADGEVEGFQYERLTVVLLKELQTLRARVAQLEAKGA
jgi:hypothetical protein